jgi:hypothetical protein
MLNIINLRKSSEHCLDFSKADISFFENCRADVTLTDFKNEKLMFSLDYSYMGAGAARALAKAVNENIIVEINQPHRQVNVYESCNNGVDIFKWHYAKFFFIVGCGLEIYAYPVYKQFHLRHRHFTSSNLGSIRNFNRFFQA